MGRCIGAAGIVLCTTLGCAGGEGSGLDTDAPSLPLETSSSGAMDDMTSGTTTSTTGTSSTTATTTTTTTATTTSGDPTTGPDPTTTTGMATDDRVTDGVLVLYRFDEGSGTTVQDVSGVAPALDLEAPDATALSWDGEGLELTAGTIVESNGAATKLIEAITASEEFTVEAWVAPANLTQEGPARIATLSLDSANRNFTLGQDLEDYVLRIRTDSPDNLNGTSPAFVVADVVTTAPTHIIGTRHSDGAVEIYINAAPQTASNPGHLGDFSNWGDDYGFALGDELGTDERLWQGEYFLVAVYDRALTQDEVEQNFLAGP